MKIYKSLDLFSGCGGLSLGLKMAETSSKNRIETAAAVDNWQIACETFEHNLGLKPYCDSIDEKLISQIIEKDGPFDILVGGPPCQGFSTAGKRALDDPRNNLVLSYLKAVELVNPKVFVMENVSGFKSYQGGAIYAEAVSFAKNLGYTVRSAVVLASLSGVPQRRKRFLLVGSKVGNFRFPGEVTQHADSGLFEGVDTFEMLGPDFIMQNPEDGKELWTFDDATSDLPSLEAGERNESYRSGALNSLQKYFRKGAETPLDHFAVGHKPYFLEMMSYIPEGRSALDPEVSKTIPKKIRPTSGFKNSYQRILGNAPSPTITRNFTTPSSANCIHPHQNRALSIREGARCQSFPDWFDFLGTTDEKRLQIGNAVPPLLGKAIGEAILRALDGN